MSLETNLKRTKNTSLSIIAKTCRVNLTSEKIDAVGVVVCVVVKGRVWYFFIFNIYSSSLQQVVATN